MTYKVYKFTNKINGKVYIGVTKRKLETRKSEHILLSKNSPKFHFHQAIKKYGIDNFTEEVLTEAKTKDKANQLEIHYISLEDSYVNGYNMTEGGGNRGEFNHSEESKRKMSIAHKGKVLSENQKIKISKSLSGKPKTKEHNKKVKLANLGKKLLEETKLKISSSKIGGMMNQNNPSAIKVNIYDSNGILKHCCHGNFDYVCKENGLPSKALRRSYYNEGKPIYQGHTTKKEVLIKNKEFIGWYAIKIIP